MLFDFTLTVPAGTLRTDPIVTLAPLTRGKLTQVRIMFPPGPATLVHVVIRHNLHQLVPANFDGDINFDDVIITSAMSYELIDPPYELSMIGWSPTAIYSHEITVQFNLEPNENENWDVFNQTLFSMGDFQRERP